MTLWKLFESQRLYGKLNWKTLRDIKTISPVLLAFVRDGSIFFALYVNSRDLVYRSLIACFCTTPEPVVSFPSSSADWKLGS